ANVVRVATNGVNTGNRDTTIAERQEPQGGPPVAIRSVRPILNISRSTVPGRIPVCLAMHGTQRAAPGARTIVIRQQSSASPVAVTLVGEPQGGRPPYTVVSFSP